MIHQLVKIRGARPAAGPKIVESLRSYVVFPLFPLLPVEPRTTPISLSSISSGTADLVVCTYRRRRMAASASVWSAANDT